MVTLLTLAITALELLAQEKDQQSISSVVEMTMQLKQEEGAEESESAGDTGKKGS